MLEDDSVPEDVDFRPSGEPPIHRVGNGYSLMIREKDHQASKLDGRCSGVIGEDLTRERVPRKIPRLHPTRDEVFES